MYFGCQGGAMIDKALNNLGNSARPIADIATVDTNSWNGKTCLCEGVRVFMGERE